MARPATSMRLDAALTDAKSVQRAQRLMATLHAGNAELFRGALDVLDWCVRQVQEGRRIASIDPSRDVDGAREFSSPLLEAARSDDPHDAPLRVLSAEAFDQVVQLIENPPAPTPELRALMAEAYSR